MRRALAPIAAALALLGAACSVKTEGAPCADDGQCPSGQACGFDKVCSKEAASCPPTKCIVDECSPGTDPAPRECKVDAAGICATLQPASPATCGPGRACGVLGGVADCIGVSIVAPGPAAVVDATGVDVTASLTYLSPRLVPPATLSLEADGNPAATLGSPSDVNKTVTYVGHYSPGPTTEGPVSLTAEAAVLPAPVSSPPVPVNADGRKPRITSVLASCAAAPAPCLRDDVLTVSADVSDLHLSSVVASLDLDGHASTVTMTSGGGATYTAQLALRDWPFGGYSRDVVARVTAADTYDNSIPAEVTVPGVTRARSAFDTQTAAAVTSPAVEDSGSIAFGVGGSANQLRVVDPDGTVHQWTLEISGGLGQDLKAAPSVGGVDLFAASEDGRIYRRNLDGSDPGGTSRYPTTTNTTAVPYNALFTPIVRNALSVDHAYSAGGAAALYQFYSDQSTATLGLANGEAVHGAGAFSGSNPFFATSDGTAATLRRFSDIVLVPLQATAIPLDPGPPAAPCDRVQVPLAVDGSGSVIAACDNGQVHRVANGSPFADELLYALSAGVRPTGSPVVLADGGIVIPASDGNVVKLMPGATSATVAWATSVAATAGEFPVGSAAADGAGGRPAIYATTSKGRLVALDASGTVLWSGVLDAGGGALGFPAIAPAPATPATALPTLYAGSASGKLYRVVVDTGLDPAAPWPKAHRDPKNTGAAP
jgi:hypothetical protein